MPILDDITVSLTNLSFVIILLFAEFGVIWLFIQYLRNKRHRR
ncbi:hypothetical protein [Anaerosporobacter faecicola]|nr:hypothetical protein [Anaerosporobacter faecicola]